MNEWIVYSVASDDAGPARAIENGEFLPDGAQIMDGSGFGRVRFMAKDADGRGLARSLSVRFPGSRIRCLWAGVRSFGMLIGGAAFLGGRPEPLAIPAPGTRDALLMAEDVTGRDIKGVYDKAASGKVAGERGLSWFAAVRGIARERRGERAPGRG